MSDNTSGGAGPDPSVTVTEASAWYQALMSFAGSTDAAGFIQTHAAMSHAMNHVRTPGMVAKIFGAILSLGAEIVAGALNALDDIKSEGGSGINDLTAAALTELLGTQVNINPSSEGGSGNATVNPGQTGAAVFNQLVDMFGGFQQITPAQGAANAQQFLGFGVNFAVITAFLGIIGGLIPQIHLDELKGIGEEVRSSLGLGRLTHTAITPLVRNMISQPLDLWLRAQLRPDRLAEAQLVKGLRAGIFSEDGVRTQLAEKGYPDDAIDFLLSDLSVKLGLTDLVLLLQNGTIQEQDVINNLTLTGMPEDQAKLQLLASQLASAKTQQMALLSELENAYVAGFVSQDQYNNILGTIPLSDEEEQAFRAKVGFRQEVPRKTLSFAEVEAAIVDNIVDFSYLDQWFTNEGYDPQAQNILSFNVLKKIQSAQDKVKFAEYKAAVLQKAGKPVPPWITSVISGT